MKAKLDNGILSVIDDQSMKKDIANIREIAIIQQNLSDEVINAILSKKEEDRTTEELLKIIARKNIEDEYNRELEKIESYLPFQETVYKGEPLGEYQSLMPYFEEENGVIYKRFRPKNDSQKVQDKINHLKQELTDSDYKVIKMYEAKILMEEMPYDESVIYERQKLRDEINELEELVKTF